MPSKTTKSRVSKTTTKKPGFQFRWWMALILVGIVGGVGMLVYRFSNASDNNAPNNSLGEFEFTPYYGSENGYRSPLEQKTNGNICMTGRTGAGFYSPGILKDIPSNGSKLLTLCTHSDSSKTAYSGKYIGYYAYFESPSPHYICGLLQLERDNVVPPGEAPITPMKRSAQQAVQRSDWQHNLFVEAQNDTPKVVGVHYLNNNRTTYPGLMGKVYPYTVFTIVDCNDLSPDK